jgi:Tol biopolymer transport system component
MDLENRKIETIAENISMSYLGMKPVSPNEEEFVFETEEGEITIFNLKQHSFRKLINGVKMSLPSWSPDGQYIIFQQQGDKTKKGAAAWRGDFYIIHPDGTGKRLIMSQKEVLSPLLYARGYRVTAMIEWTPDNRYIIFSRMAGSDGESSITLVLDFKIGDIVELPSKYEIK